MLASSINSNLLMHIAMYITFFIILVKVLLTKTIDRDNLCQAL
jgi:hypothetical protein